MDTKMKNTQAALVKAKTDLLKRDKENKYMEEQYTGINKLNESHSKTHYSCQIQLSDIV